MIPSLKGKSARGTTIAFGEYGLKAITNGYISNREIEAARKVVVRHTRKTGKLRIRVFPDLPFTKKGLEMPMGKGKGDVDIYKAPIRRGKVILEVSGIDEDLAKKVLISASKKLSVQARFTIKGEIQ
ncbi:MAG: 50S ribosomal protein L16 [Candidatus Absconditabacterales bacterium]|nr:50S ribosomal protein L16 [Candidatus Absconditabacterales bacterium]